MKEPSFIKFYYVVLFVGFIFMNIVAKEEFPILPAGMVIDGAFLSSLKTICFFERLAIIIFAAMVGLPFAFAFCQKNIAVPIVCVALLCLSLYFYVPFISTIGETPKVEVCEVSDKHCYRNRKSWNIYTIKFDDDSRMNATFFYFGNYINLSKREEVYLVKLDGDNIGAFSTNKYRLGDDVELSLVG